MPRVLPPPVPKTSKLRWWWQNGTILIGTGWVGLGILVLDRYLQHIDRQDADRMVGFIEFEPRMKRGQLIRQFQHSPVRFRCVERVEYKMAGTTTHGLMVIKVNDLLEVLQGGVGPGGYYNLCRKVDADGNVESVGLYPIGFFEKEH